MTLREGIEKLAELEGENHFVLCNRMGGEDITYNIKDQTFNNDEHLLTEEDVTNDKCDTWHIYKIENINGYSIRKPIGD